MTKGLFRTITGKIGKIAPKKFKIKTKNATIGIRGTEIVIKASPIGGDKIACTRGAISVVSNFTGKSVDVEAGKITEVKPNASPAPPREFKAGDIEGLDKKKEKEDKKATEKESKNKEKSKNEKKSQDKQNKSTSKEKQEKSDKTTEQKTKEKNEKEKEQKQ